MPFRSFIERRRRERLAGMLYMALVNQARLPVFYAEWGVPDTLEGRYDMVVLHAWLLMRRLGTQPSDEARALSQATFDLMFADMDQSLREMGVTDTGVGKRIRRMAEAFYGRCSAYDKAQEEGRAALEAALARNLYQKGDPSPEQLARMAAYVLDQQEQLAKMPDEPILSGSLAFTAPEK